MDKNNDYKSDDKNTGLKFDTKDFLEVVKESSKRTRKILILMIFSSLLIIMALINSSDKSLNWFISRSAIIQNAAKYFYFDDEIDAEGYYHAFDTKTKPVTTLNEFIKINESFYKTDTTYLTKKIKNEIPNFNVNSIYIRRPPLDSIKEPSLSKRFVIYKDISKSLEYILSHGLGSRSEINEKIKSLNNAQLEHINLVRVPILGISFDINYLGFYSGLAMTILYWLLYSALKREHVNTKITFKRAWMHIKNHHSYDFYEYMSMLQVLNMPGKLFEPINKYHFLTKNNIFLALVFPFVACALVVLNDWYSFHLGEEVNLSLTRLCFRFELFFLLLTLTLFLMVFWQWRKMNQLWENQILEYNFEFILECIGANAPIDLIQFADQVLLKKENYTDIQRMWYYNSLRIQKKKKKTQRACLNIFNNFINNVLKADFKQANKIQYDNEVEEHWKVLWEWFESYGKTNITKNFQESFYNMCMSLPKLNLNSQVQ